MEKQQKWVQLFEQVIGRKPSPQEFMAGKEADFDLKAIKRIAGVLAEDEVAPSVAQDATVQPPVAPAVETATPPAAPVQPMPVNVVPTSSLGGGVPPQPLNPVAKAPWSKQKKLKAGLGALAAFIVVALAGGYYYMEQQTGADVAASDFLNAIKKEDYSTLANNFSTDEEKWTQADVKSFLIYLDDQTNVGTEIEKMAEDPSYSYKDDNGNQLIGMRKTGDTFGLFPTYKVTSYPVEVFVKTNLDSLTVNKEKLPKNKEVSLGKYAFISKQFALTGQTELGQIETEITSDATKAKNNEVHLSLNSVEKTIKATLPNEVSGSNDVKLFINDKEVAKSLEKKVKVLENQTLTVHSQFIYEGATYSTDKTDMTVSPDKDSMEVDLKVSEEVIKKVEAAKKAKVAKEAEAQKEKEIHQNIKTFMSNYINAMRDSIRYRRNDFAQYYDTSSAAYQTMDNYVEGGGVAREKVDYQVTLDYTVTNISKEGNNYAVTVHNQFRNVFLDGDSTIVEKNQVFKLRPNGSSFLIYEISEY